MPDTPPPAPLNIAALDTMPEAAFMAAFGNLFEHSPWIMAQTAAARPYGNARALHNAAMAAIRSAPPDAQLALIRAHPELAGQEAAAHSLTADSTSEQARLGFTRLTQAEHAELASLNAQYRARFAFPCIVALARHQSRDTVYQAFRTRMTADPATERATAITEIGHVTEARLTARLGRTRGGLTLHALDTTKGGGAPNLAFQLSRNEAGTWRPLTSGATNAEGRTDTPVLAPLDMEPGQYRIEYHVADYHRAQGIELPDPPFLDIVPIQFGIADATSHHHVPLQFTPWTYATYRGS